MVRNIELRGDAMKKGVMLLILLIMLALVLSVVSAEVINVAVVYDDVVIESGSFGDYSNRIVVDNVGMDYDVYFKSDPTEGQVVSVTRDGVESTFQPMALNFRNDLSQIQQIQMINSVTGQLTSDSHSFIYQDAYGSGIDLVYTSNVGYIKEELVIESFSDLPLPAQYIIDGGNPRIDLDFVFGTDSNKIIVDGVEWDKSSTQRTSNDIYVKDDDGNVLYYFPRPYVIDSVGKIVYGDYSVKKSGNKLYMIVEIPYSFFEAVDTVYPVYIDPTYTVDYSPTPGEHLTNGTSTVTDDNTFNIADITVGVSDNNDSTSYEVKRSVSTPQGYIGPDSLVDNYEYDIQSGQDSYSMKISDGVYAVVYDGYLGDGYIKTLNISDDGIVVGEIDVLEFDTSDGHTPTMLNVNGTVYVIAYEGGLGDGFVVTVDIQDNGIISDTVLDSFEFDVLDGEAPDIFSIDTGIVDNIVGIAYTGGLGDGFIKTLNISANGSIVGEVDVYEFDLLDGGHPSITNVSDEVYFIAYESTSNFGYVKTINISKIGVINGTMETYTEGVTKWTANVVHLIDDIYMVGHSSSTFIGTIDTYQVLGNGSITYLDTFQFEDTEGRTPSLIEIDNLLWVVFYEGDQGDGYVTSFSMLANGSSSNNSINIVEYDFVDGNSPFGFIIDGKVGVAYTGSGTDGFVQIFNYTLEDVLDDVSVITSKFSQVYDSSYDYWLRLRKVTPGTEIVTVYAYYNDSTVNASQVTTKELVGTGWFNVNVSQMMEYMSLLYNYTKFRFFTDDPHNFSEVRLRKEQNDTTIPYITDCTVSDTLIYNNEFTRLQCNVTDDIDVEAVNFTVGPYVYSTIQNDSYYYVDIQCNSSIDGFNDWSLVEAWDIVFNYNSTDPNLNFTCIYDDINITLIDYYGLNSSLGRIDNFTTDYLQAIEKVVLNFTVTGRTPLDVDSWYFNFTASGTNGCAPGNKQHSICYNIDNETYTWIQFQEGVNTATFDGIFGNVGDSINVVKTVSGDGLTMNISLTIDEHYNPNIFKWYDAVMNFSYVKWQNDSNIRVKGGGNFVKIEVDDTIVPLDADEYKLDMRLQHNYPDNPLEVYACNDSYTTGHPHDYAGCAFVAEKYWYDLQDDGTKFREVVTTELIDQIGNVKYIILELHSTNTSKYFAIKTYKATAENYTTKWEYSSDGGQIWTNAGDGYETEFNINWFYALNPTNFDFRLWGNTTYAESYSENNITWSIDPTINYPPLVSIQDPSPGTQLSLDYDIDFTTNDANNDNLNVSIYVYYENGTLYETLVTDLDETDDTYAWTGTPDGIYNLVVEACELNTTELFCANDTAGAIIVNTPPQIYNITFPSVCEDVCTFTFNIKDVNSDDVDFTDMIWVISVFEINFTVSNASYYLQDLSTSPTGNSYSLTVNMIDELGYGSYPKLQLWVETSDGYSTGVNISNEFSVDTTRTKKVFEEISVGPEYGRGDKATILVSLQDYDGHPIFGENITIRVYYPDYSQWFNDTMTEIVPGVYQYERNITYLSPYGDYIIVVYSDNFFTSDIFQVQPFIDYIEDILNIVVSINNTVEGTYELVTNINTTVNDVYSYLQNTIYPEIDEVEELLNDTLIAIANLNTTVTGNVTIDLSPIYQRFDALDGNITEIDNTLSLLEIYIGDINQSITNEINFNEAKLDIIDGVVDSIKYYIENNMTVDLDYIINMVDAINFTTDSTYSYLQNTIYPEIDEVEEKLDEVLVNTTNIWDKLLIIENNVTKNQVEIFVMQNMLQNINQTLITELNQNEAKLDIIDGVVDSIYSYITVNMTVDLSYIISVVDVINLTTDSIYSYLQNTIYPEIDGVEEKLDEVLVNTTNIWDKLVIIGDNVTTNYNRLLIIENMIDNVNQTLLTEINQNEAYLIYVNGTTSTILNRVQTIVEPALLDIQVNITNMQQDLDTIYNSVDTLEAGQQSILGNLSAIELKIDALQFNFTSILTDITNIDTKLTSMNVTMIQRFNTLDAGQSSIISLINDIEAKLDCNFTVNIVCDKLDAMTITINQINTTSNFISGYLTGTVTNYLIDINQTVYNIYDYLQNIIYPEIDDAEEKLDEILVNTTNIWDKLISLQTDINITYNKIVDVETLVIITNQTLVNEINENELRLINLNITVTQILSEIINNVEPALLDIQVNITDMQIDMDTIITKIDQQTQYLSDNFTLLNQKIDALQFNFTSLLTDISNLDSKLTSMNLTMIQRFDIIDSSLSTIITEVTNIEAKLDCNHTINVVCDRLDNILNYAIEINTTTHIIDTYLTGVVTTYLIDINQTINAIYTYLQNTIYPAIDEAESKLDEILFNTTNIWDKLLVLEGNVTSNYNELINIKYMLENINSTMVNELNENENILIIMNNTINLILSEIQTVVEPSLLRIENNITDMQIDIDMIISNTDTLEQGQLYILSNITLLHQKIDDLQFNFSSITIDINSLTNSLLSINVSMHDRFDGIATTQSSIISLINDIENKLDCNHTFNIICDKLDVMTVTINDINSTVNYIQLYIEGNVTDYLFNIYDLLNITNTTINDIYDFLANQGRFPSEIDLLLDDVAGDLTRSQGTVNVTTYLVNPINSTGDLNLYIDGVLNQTSYNYISKLITFNTGTYTIKAKFDGDGINAPSTEVYVLTITSNNSLPVVNLQTPIESESVNLPYNITFSVSDNDILNVSIFLYESGQLNTTIVTDLIKNDNSYYWAVSQPAGVYQMVLQACEINTFDLYCVNDTHTISLNLSCVPSWNPIYGGCQIDNTRYLTYNDTSQCGTLYGLPGDNGTYVYCNYCSEDIQGPFYNPTVCPTNQTQLRYYYDNNYVTCCQVTGLLSDCSIDYSPYTNQSVVCSYLANQLTLQLDTSPYIEDRIPVIADLGFSNATKCWTYVKKENEILQTSPQRNQYEESLLFSKVEESREYFEPVGGVVNAYYTKENLLAYEDFVVGVRCALSNGTILEGEEQVVPVYKDLRRVTSRAVWGVSELPTLIFISVFILIILGLVIYAWKK